MKNLQTILLSSIIPAPLLVSGCKVLVIDVDILTAGCRTEQWADTPTRSPWTSSEGESWTDAQTDATGDDTETTTISPDLTIPITPGG